MTHRVELELGSVDLEVIVSHLVWRSRNTTLRVQSPNARNYPTSCVPQSGTWEAYREDMPKYMMLRFDVTGLTEDQIDALTTNVSAQAEAYDDDERETYHYPDVKVEEVCPYCHQPLDYTNGAAECGGADEGICTEWMAVQEFEDSSVTASHVESFVAEFMTSEGIEDAVMPYRNDGLMYSGYLAAILRKRFDLETK